MKSLSLRRFAGCSAAIWALSSAPAVHAQAAYSFDLPRQSLELSLQAVGGKTGENIVVDTRLIRGLVAPVLRGAHDAEGALHLLLKGSGLSVTKTRGGSFVISRARPAQSPADRSGARPAAPDAEQTRLHAEGEAQARTAEPEEPSEIVVTAQKRSESIREVPSSISAISGEQLERSSARQLADFAAYIPGFQVDTAGPAGLGRLTLRGITVGTMDSTSVGTYVDDVPLGSSSTYLNAGGFTLDLMPYDIERVEVLRGPQGTLYGASTMGGLLKYVTRNPNLNDFELRVGGDLADTRHADGLNWIVRGGLNVPIVEDKLALRVSGFSSDRAGYVNNAATGEKDVNDGTQKGGRAALLWKPTDDIKVKLTAMVQKTDFDGSANIAFDPIAQAPVYGYFQAFRYLQEGFEQQHQLYTATIDWDFGWASLTSATSFSKMRSTVTADATVGLSALAGALLGLPTAPLVGATTTADLDKFTQEVRLASPTGRKFEWMLGTFYTDEDAHLRQVVVARDAQTEAPLPAPSNPFIDGEIPSQYREFALFGNATYRFTDRFDVSAGLRWAKNKQRFKQIIGGFLPELTGSASSDSGTSSDDTVTYMASARYKIAPEIMVYGRVATSYRPGGPNIAVVGLAPSFGPDTLTNYEIGLRSQFADRRVTFDLTAFYIDWDDIQISVCSNGLCGPDNGGAARSKGLELSTSVKPLDGLRLGLNGAYTDARLRSLAAGANIPGAMPGDRLPLAPKWSGALTADYEFAVTSAIDGRVGAGYRMVGSRNSTFAGDPINVRLPAYQALDLNVGLSTALWRLSIYARNLLDERAFLSGGTGTAAILEPRTIGLAVDFTF